MKGSILQTTTTMETILSNIGTFFTSALGWLGDAVDVVVEHPLLFIMVGAIPIAGVAIGYLSRLTRL